MKRKGMGKGQGKGYKNMVGKDPMVHSQSAKGMKQPQKVNMLRNMKPQIGDGRSPNLYWVSWSNNFYICKKGQCDWASDRRKFKVKSETTKKPFKTFKEAQDYIDNNLFISDVPKEDSINNIIIDDRYSGRIYEESIFAYTKETEGIIKQKSFVFEIERRFDTDFTEKEMEKRGETFK